jgi:peptidoglycan/xylan/chitin deacetylase (PgdA/CDA1 family)
MPPARILLWVASLGALAMLVRTLLIGPIPTWVAAIALLLYLFITWVGWFYPQTGMYGQVLWRGPGDDDRVALTFDDGPNPITTPKILAILARGGHRATFFLVGSKAQAHPELVREIHRAGHTLGLHGFFHDRLYAFKPPGRVVADVRAAQQAVADACGVRPTLLRPPMGHVSPRTVAGARRAGVTLVSWSVAALDGLRGATSDRVLRRISRRLGGGTIAVLHDSAERDDFEPASVQALPAILAEIDSRGLRAVGVDEFLTTDSRLGPGEPQSAPASQPRA